VSPRKSKIIDKKGKGLKDIYLVGGGKEIYERRKGNLLRGKGNLLKEEGAQLKEERKSIKGGNEPIKGGKETY
jgi:hypothetical protein